MVEGDEAGELTLTILLATVHTSYRIKAVRYIIIYKYHISYVIYHIYKRMFPSGGTPVLAAAPLNWGSFGAESKTFP